MSRPRARVPAAEVTLAVLTGGRSRRMGRDKASLPVEGGRVLGAIGAEALRGLYGEVLTAGPPVPGLAARAVADALPGAGPLSGVVAALEDARTPLVVVIACDMPRLSSALVSGLLGEAAGGSRRVTLCRGPNGLEPLPSVWRREAASDLRRQLAGGVRALRDAVSAAGPRVVEPDRWRRWDPVGASFLSWNALGEVER